MFGIGPLELVVIAVVAIVFVGPKRLPEVMQKFGRFFVQMRRQTQDIRDTFNEVVRDAEREIEIEKVRELKRKLEQVQPKNFLNNAIEKAVHLEPSHEYHESHYIDGEYVNKDSGFLRAEDLANNHKDLLIPQKASEQTYKPNPEAISAKTEPEAPKSPAAKDQSHANLSHAQESQNNAQPEPSKPTSPKT